ncbi:MAG: Fic family protein [Acidimicrobiaceae bacterium]|nr:Fic family protein [Acidimicrobiaceae bacterium]
MIDLDGSPYSLEDTGGWVIDEAASLQERVELLRGEGRLSEATLRAYFGEKRFEQIAESNAIEGSTLSVGETQMAVLRGITITGHDPAFAKDAVNLSKALERMVELARDPSPTTLGQVKELHGLILGDGAGAGLFRSQPVRIAGSPHRPPSSWGEVMSAMEDWDRWSGANTDVLALLRAIVLHTWLTHIHPFTDGNGRTSRAIMNLELIRAGLPSIIIRRKDRLRYYEALAESDLGGDLGPISELILARAEDALRDLERKAAAHEGYDRARAELRRAQERQVAIWNDAVQLLFSLVDDALDAAVGDVGRVSTRWYEDELLVEDYAVLARGDPAGNSWLYRINVEIPALSDRRLLAWTGYRSYAVQGWQEIGAGPSIFWSVPDPSGYRHWIRDDSQSPGVAELTLHLPNVDTWIARLPEGGITRLPPSEVAQRIAHAVVKSITAS